MLLKRSEQVKYCLIHEDYDVNFTLGEPYSRVYSASGVVIFEILTSTVTESWAVTSCSLTF
jgi:hypothetical protein